MNSQLPHDVSAMTIGLSIIAFLLLLTPWRMFGLYRSNRRLRGECAKMEKHLALQELEVTAVHHDSMSWRAKMQRQFDALRSELSHQLQQADMSGSHALSELDKACQQMLANADAREAELAAAKSRISELESTQAVKPVSAPPPFVPKPALPALPAMETLRIQSLEAELSAVKSELTLARQQNATLQLTALLARRKTPVSAASSRKSPLRGRAVRCS